MLEHRGLGRDRDARHVRKDANLLCDRIRELDARIGRRGHGLSSVRARLLKVKTGLAGRENLFELARRLVLVDKEALRTGRGARARAIATR